MNNIKFSEEDVNVIKEMAEKYKVSVQSLCKLVSKSTNDQIVIQVRFSEKELEKINTKSEKYKMNRSKFCRECCKKAIETNYISKINVVDIATEKGKDKKPFVINISFPNIDDYRKFESVACDHDIKIGTLLRYLVLNIEL